MSDKETGASAGGLLSYLQEAFSPKKKKPTEAPAVEAVAPTTTPTPIETIASVPEPTPTMVPQLTSTEAPTPSVDPFVTSELPDWLSASAAEPVSVPEPEAPPVMETPVVEMPVVAAEAMVAVEAPVSAPEAPSALPAAEAEKNPEQLVIGQFEEALLSADGTLTRVRVGESVDETQLRAAKAAAATANGLIRNLPERYLKVLLASRRVGENREYGRFDFQRDMMAAIRVFSQAIKR